MVRVERDSSATPRIRVIVGQVSDPSEAESSHVIAELAQAVPVLRAVLDEHIDPHDEVLPYVVFADFRRALEDLIDAGDEESVTAFLDVIERWSGSRSDPAHAYDGAARNMIAVAFLEDGLILSGGRESRLLNSLRRRFGPQTLELLAQTEANNARAVATWRARSGD